MLWSEFKILVDNELDGLNPEIEYIDISATFIDTTEVFIDKENNSIEIH